jgi:hypothetical protein
MASEPAIAAFEVSPVAQPCAALFYAEVADYWALTKPDINFPIAIATVTNYHRPLFAHAKL